MIGIQLPSVEGQEWNNRPAVLTPLIEFLFPQLSSWTLSSIPLITCLLNTIIWIFFNIRYYKFSCFLECFGCSQTFILSFEFWDNFIKVWDKKTQLWLYWLYWIIKGRLTSLQSRLFLPKKKECLLSCVSVLKGPEYFLLIIYLVMLVFSKWLLLLIVFLVW